MVLHVALNQFYSVLRPEIDPSVCMGMNPYLMLAIQDHLACHHPTL